MMKLTLTAFILILMQQVCFGQNLSQWDTKIDSLQNQLLNPSSNTAKIKTIFELSSVLIGKAWTTTNLGQFAIAYESFSIMYPDFRTELISKNLLSSS